MKWTKTPAYRRIHNYLRSCRRSRKLSHKSYLRRAYKGLAPPEELTIKVKGNTGAYETLSSSRLEGN